jgi:hypothetical protein
LIGSVLRKKSTDVSADNTPKISQQDGLDFPDFLRVENRRPLTSEQRARLDAVMAANRAPQQAQDDLRALQLATKKKNRAFGSRNSWRERAAPRRGCH